MTRHVLVVNHFANPRSAPGGTRHIELFTRLQGWDATIVAANRNLLTRRSVSIDEGSFRTVWSWPYSSNGPARVLNWVSYAVTAFAAGMRMRRPDVVYASSPHLLAGLSGWAIARLRRAPLVLEVRDLWPRILVDMGQMSASSPVYRILRLMERFLYRRADAIVAMAGGVVEELREREGIDPSRIFFVPNGADPEDLVPSAARPVLRDRHGLDGLVFAYTGAHGPANGLDLVLDAATAVADDHPDVRFLLVGDGVAKAGLEQRAARDGIDNVEFRDPIPKSEMADLLGAVDVGLHVLADVPLFRYGVSPNKLFDYMAAGLPVLTNTSGEVAALVGEAGAGVAVASDRLADGVRTLARAGEEERRRLGRSGRDHMAQHRSRRALAQRVQDVLDGLAPCSARSDHG